MTCKSLTSFRRTMSIWLLQCRMICCNSISRLARRCRALRIRECSSSVTGEVGEAGGSSIFVSALIPISVFCVISVSREHQDQRDELVEFGDAVEEVGDEEHQVVPPLLSLCRRLAESITCLREMSQIAWQKGLAQRRTYVHFKTFPFSLVATLRNDYASFPLGVSQGSEAVSAEG